MAEWAMPEVEAQIQGLRAAFSANLDKPFELKPTFPYGTPSEQSRSPVERRSSEPQHQGQPSQNHYFYQQPLQHGSYYTPSPSLTGSATKPQTSQFYHDYDGNHASHQYHQMPPTSNPNNAITPTEHWNPTPIIDQFNNAFAIPQSALAPPPPSSYSSSPPVTLPQQGFHAQMQNQQYVPSPSSATGYSAHPYTPSPTSQAMPNPQSYMSTQSQNTPRPQLTPGHYHHQQGVNSYFDANLKQSSSQSHISATHSYGSTDVSFDTNPEGAGPNTPVYVTPKEWQQSVASVFDPNGLKRKWSYDQQLAMQQQGHVPGQYGRIG